MQLIFLFNFFVHIVQPHYWNCFQWCIPQLPSSCFTLWTFDESIGSMFHLNFSQSMLLMSSLPFDNIQSLGVLLGDFNDTILGRPGQSHPIWQKLVQAGDTQDPALACTPQCPVHPSCTHVVDESTPFSWQLHFGMSTHLWRLVSANSHTQRTTKGLWVPKQGPNLDNLGIGWPSVHYAVACSISQCMISDV